MSSTVRSRSVAAAAGAEARHTSGNRARLLLGNRIPHAHWDERFAVCTARLSPGRHGLPRSAREID
jgi:hypothetical protein